MEDDPVPDKKTEKQATVTIRTRTSGIWTLDSRKALMSQIEHFAIYADDPTALKDFYVKAFELKVIVESGGDPPGYFLADDIDMAIEVLGRPSGSTTRP